MIIKNGKTISSIIKENQVIDKIMKGTLVVYESFKNLIASGVPPLTLTKCKGVDLVDYKIFGNSIQNGTPTPDTPIEIESVGDKTINLFNKTDATMMLKARVEADGIIYDNTIQNYQTVIIKVKPNTKYTINVNVSGYTGQSPVGRNAFYTTYPTIGVTVGTVNSTLFGSTYPRTVTTPADAQYWAIWVNRSTNINQQVLDSLIIVEGEYTSQTLPSYEPYGYKIPVKVRGKNLFDINSVELTSRCEIVGNGIQFTGNGAFDIKLPAGQYTISFENNGVGNCYLRNGKVDNGIIGTAIQPTETKKTFTYTASYDGYLRVSSFNAGQMLSNIQIEKGTVATEYEPYIEPTITNIYLKEPLRKIKDFKDYIDFESKKIVRNISKIDLNTLNWIAPSGYSGYMYYTGKISDMNYSNLNIPLGLCTHYPVNSSYGGWAVADTFEGITINWNTGALGLKDMRFFKDAGSLINALKGVYLYYVLIEQDDTETIELPNIPTHKGTTIIEIDTTIQPSNMQVIYKGKEVK